MTTKDPLLEKIEERIVWWRTRYFDPVWQKTIVMDIERIKALIQADRERVLKALEAESYENEDVSLNEDGSWRKSINLEDAIRIIKNKEGE